MSAAPTPRQLALLRFVHGYQQAHGYCPSYAETGAALGLASKSNVAVLVDRCERRGLLRRLPGRARSIELLVLPPIPRAPDGTPLFFVPIEALPTPAIPEKPHGQAPSL